MYLYTYVLMYLYTYIHTYILVYLYTYILYTYSISRIVLMYSQGQNFCFICQVQKERLGDPCDPTPGPDVAPGVLCLAKGSLDLWTLTRLGRRFSHAMTETIRKRWTWRNPQWSTSTKALDSGRRVACISLKLRLSRAVYFILGQHLDSSKVATPTYQCESVVPFDLCPAGVLRRDLPLRASVEKERPATAVLAPGAPGIWNGR